MEEIMQDKVMESIIVSLIQSDSHGSDSDDEYLHSVHPVVYYNM
jgi:hypothetical protein